MTPAQIEEGRRWVALRGWRWMPGMLAARGEDAIRVCDVETMTADDVARGQALASALNAGNLVLPGLERGAQYVHVGKVGDACGLVGTKHPVAYEEDEDGGLWPAFVKTSVGGYIPDVTDPATRGCLLELAREITGRPDLTAAPAGRDWWGIWLTRQDWGSPLDAIAHTETECYLIACERHERAAAPETEP